MAKHAHADSRIIGGLHPFAEDRNDQRVKQLQTALALLSLRNPANLQAVEVGNYDLDGFDDGLGDLIGDDDDLGDLIGDQELGRRLRKRKQIKQLKRRLAASNMAPSQQAAVAKMAMLRAANAEAMSSGQAGTAGHYVADPGEREFYLPFQSAVSILAAATSAQTLTVNVQRPMMVKRIIIDALDSTTLADVLPTLGVTSILGGVDPLFNAQGVAPARSFAFNAVGNHLKSQVLRVGINLTVTLTRMVAGANPANVSGYVIGVSAQN